MKYRVSSKSLIKSVSVLIVLLTMQFCMIGCAKKTSEINFLDNDLTLNVGDMIRLETEVLPDDADNQEILFESSNESIAFVEEGILYTGSDGETTINAIQDGITFDTLGVTVREVLAENIYFSKENIDLGIGRTASLDLVFEPANTSDKSMLFEVADPSIVEVVDGQVTGILEGTTEIIAKHETGLTASCVISVQPVIPNSMSIQVDLPIKIDDTQKIQVMFNPDDVTDRRINWEVSKPSILMIEEDTLIAKGIGTVIVTARHDSGCTVSKEIEVTPVHAEDIRIIADSSKSIYEKESLVLSAEISPQNTTDKSVTWSTSNPEIATVKDGKVTGVSPGFATIIATTNNNIETERRVNVESSVRDMTVTITARCSSYNHVGNEWGEYFSVNGEQVRSGSKVSVRRNGTLSIYSEIVEYDKIADVGSSSYNVRVSTEYYENGFTVTQEIPVRENRGRYAGNIATWKVTYTFSR